MSAMPVTFMVTNSGTGTTGTPMAVIAGEFAIPTGGNKCSSGLNAGQTCTIDVVFKPGSVGAKNGTLTVSSPVGGMQVASLNGNGATTGLKITPETRDFGTAVVGATGSTVTFSVENNGGVEVSALMVSINGMDFAIPMGGSKCGATLAVGAKCAVDVQFAPKTDGDRTGTLVATGTSGPTAVSATAGLSGKAQSAAKLIVSPAAQSFTAAVGQTSGTITFTIANVGGAQSGVPMVTMGGTNATDFTMVSNGCITPLPGNGQCAVGVAFKPGAEGMKMATLTATAMPGGTATSALTGLATVGKITIAPTALDFMTASVGDNSAPQTLTVTNTGTSATGPLQVTLGGVDSSNFSLSSNNCVNAMLDPNGTCTLQVSFNPKAPAGAKSALVTINGNPGGSVAAMVSGTAVSPAVLSVAPASFDYMTIPVNTTSDKEFTVTNTGGAATGAVTTTLTGGSYIITANSCSGALAPMATCKITVSFRPTVAGAFPGTLTVASPMGGMQTVTLNGAATPAPTINVVVTGTANATFDFNGGNGGVVVNTGTVVGSQTAAQSFTVTNTGAGSTGMLAVTIEGTNMSDFIIVSNGCATLAPGVSCIVTVAFKPTATGLRSGSLVARGMGGTGSATLTGFGLAQLDVVNIVANRPPLYPAAFDFGSVTIGVTTAATTVAILNARANLGTITAAVTGENFAGNFIGATVGACDTTAATAAAPVQCNVQVQFSPKEPRTTTDPATIKTGNVVVTSASGSMTATVAVKGTAAGPLQIAPTAGSFPATAVGGTSDLNFTVTNGGAAGDSIGPLTVTVTGANASEFVKVTDNCTAALPTGGMNCPGVPDITIRFAPTSAGVKTATLTVSGVVNHPAGPPPVPTGVTETVTVTLTGSAGAVTPITLNPTALTFAATAAGGQSATQMITVTNPASTATTGAITLAKTGSFPLEFTVTGNTCITALGPNATCQLTVRFDPTAGATGSRTATLTVTAGAGNSASASLSGTVSAAISFNEGAHNFGSVIVGDATATPVNFTLTNNTAAVFTVATVGVVAGTGMNALPAHFVLTQGTPTCAGGSTINPGATCVLSIRYVPLVGPGVQTADLQITGTIAGMGGTPLTATSHLTGTAVVDANLDIQGVADGTNVDWDFGQVVVGGTDMRTARFKLLNSGGSTSSPISILRVFNAAGWSTVPNTLSSEITLNTGAGECTEGQTLDAGASCNLTVLFQPAMAALRQATLQVQANGLRGGSTGTVRLQGTGRAAATLHVDATNGHDLGATFAGVAATSGVDFTLTNSLPPAGGGANDVLLIAAGKAVTGPANASGADFTLGAPSSGTACVFGGVGATNLTPGTSCNFKVTFTPAGGVGAVAPGLDRAILTLGNLAGAIATTVGVWGRVQTDVTFTATDPTGVVGGVFNFGKVVVGAMSATQTFTLKNIGERDSGAIAVNTTGDFALDATVVNNCNGSSVVAGGTCSVGIKFVPTSTVNPRNGTFVVTPTVGAALTTNVTGSGATNANLTVAAGVAFGTKPLGGQFTEDFLVTNTGAANVDTGALSFSLMGGSGQFSIDQSQNVGGAPASHFCAQGEALVAADSCVVRVLWVPGTVATVSTILNVTASPGGTINTTVSGTGQIGVQIADDMGHAAADTITTTFANPANHTFTVSMRATAGDSGILSVGLGAADQGFSILTNNCANVSLTSAGGGTTCTIVVRYAPAAAGAHTTTLSVSGTTTGNTAVATLNGS